MNFDFGRTAELIDATGDFDPTVLATGYSIDSRTLKPLDLFFAVRGDRLDGHDFVAAAIGSGASGAVVAREKSSRFSSTPGSPGSHLHSRLLLVEDPLQALQQLAAAARRLWGKRVIGVTGSAGKTTTKEAIAQVLSRQFSVFKSQGNLNNAYGLPLQLLRLEPWYEVAVLELGMSHAGEIARLAEIAKPDWGVVTNVAPAHLENFPEGVSGVARAKYELIQGLPPGGLAVLNADDPFVSQFGRDFHGRVVTYGCGSLADVRAEEVRELGVQGTEFVLSANGTRIPARLPLIGMHNVMNALAAAAVSLASGMKLSDCAAALEGLRPAANRGEVLQLRGATVINDCYNSNPKALAAMVDALTGIEATRRIVIAGEMLELGPESVELHRASGRHMTEKHIDLVVGVRGNAEHIVSGASEGGTRALFVSSPEEAGAWIRAELQPGDAVLIKGSRGVHLERALEALGM